MKINPKRLLLGTANFKTKYGFKSFFISQKNSQDIINLAERRNIDGFDISTNYNFINDIKKINFNKKNSISLKISNKIYKNIYNIDKLRYFLNSSFNSPKKQKIDFILFHRSKDLFTKKGLKIYRILRFYKKIKKVLKIGVSVYDLNEVKKILKAFKVDVLQIPLNVLDQRFIDPKLLRIFKKRKIELHARSVFLQGLILDKNIAPKKLRESIGLKKWFSYLKANKLNSLSESLNFVNQQKHIKKIIIGVRSKSQLDKILNVNFFKKKDYSEFKNSNINLIDPRKW